MRLSTGRITIRTVVLIGAGICTALILWTINVLCDWGLICQFSPVTPEFAFNASPCLRRYLHEIPDDRVGATRVGNSDVDVPGSEGAYSKPFGLIVMGSWKPIGALRFTYKPTARAVNIDSIIDASCRPVERYYVLYRHHNDSYDSVPAYRYGDRNIVSATEGSNDVLWMYFGNTAYELRLWHNGKYLEGELW